MKPWFWSCFTFCKKCKDLFKICQIKFFSFDCAQETALAPEDAMQTRLQAAARIEYSYTPLSASENYFISCHGREGCEIRFPYRKSFGRLSDVSRLCSYFHSNKSRCEKPETGNHAPRTFVNTRFSTKRSSCSLRINSFSPSRFHYLKRQHKKGGNDDSKSNLLPRHKLEYVKTFLMRKQKIKVGAAAFEAKDFNEIKRVT